MVRTSAANIAPKKSKTDILYNSGQDNNIVPLLNYKPHGGTKYCFCSLGVELPTSALRRAHLQNFVFFYSSRKDHKCQGHARAFTR